MRICRLARSCCGCSPGPGSGPPRPRGARRGTASERRSRSAGGATPSVRIPAQGVEGVERRRGGAVENGVRPDSASRSASPATTPSVASLWPAMPFVAECSDRSTPCASGCWPSGVANVESTRVNGPLIEPSSSRSTNSSRGLDGDSARTSIVRPGSTAAANAPGSVTSTNVSRCPGAGTGPAGTPGCRRRAVAGRRCGCRSNTGGHASRQRAHAGGEGE